MTWRDLREQAEHALAAAGIESPAAEARWIVDRASGVRGSELFSAQQGDAEGTAPPPSRAAARVGDMVSRRAAGEPLQYVLAEWSFRGLDLFVDRRVLIPRPETEVTAQVAIDAAGGATARRRAVIGHASFPVADLGTGSGAIALALASELPGAEVWATDVSDDALAVARANLASIGSAATRVRLAGGDWFEALPAELRSRLRVVVANPPYVTDAEFEQLPTEIRAYEPRMALVSGPTGLEAIARITTGAPEWLEPGGTLVVEVAPDLARAASDAARAAGFKEVSVVKDLTGRERVLVARVQS